MTPGARAFAVGFTGLVLCAAQTCAADSPRYYGRVAVLAIGVGQYASNELSSPAYAAKDAEDFAKLMREAYGFEPKLLLDSEATRARIEDEIDSLSQSLTAKDVLIVFFAGHGDVVERQDYGHTGYLIPYDAQISPLEDGKNTSKWDSQCLGMKDLAKKASASPAKHVVFVLDACCSGSMGARSNLAQRPDLQTLLQSPSRVVLAATTERGKARSAADGPNGYFTSALLKTLKSKQAMSITDLFVDVRKSVIAASNKSQIPTLRPLDGDGEFIFLPLAIPEKEVEIATRPNPSVKAHVLAGVERSALQRVAQKSQLSDLLRTHQATDYRFSNNPEERAEVWKGRTERLALNAATDDPFALAALYYCYLNGLGVERDPKMAGRFAQRAFDTGEVAGKHVLGSALRTGTGVPKNEIAGWRLIEEADRAKFPLSSLSVGYRLWDEGKIEEARKKLESLATDDFPSGQLAFAAILVRTNRNSQDALKRGEELLLKAANAGSPEAEFILAEFYDFRKNQELSNKHLREAAEQGFPAAQSRLAIRIAHPPDGKKVLADGYAEAARWAELAATQQDPWGAMQLSELYQNGQGVKMDLDQARKYLDLAVDLNSARAMAVKAINCSQGVLYPKNEALVRQLIQKSAEMKDALGCRLLGMAIISDTARSRNRNARKQDGLMYLTQAVQFGNDSLAIAELVKFNNECGMELDGLPIDDGLASMPLETLEAFQTKYPEQYSLYREIISTNATAPRRTVPERAEAKRKK